MIVHKWDRRGNWVPGSQSNYDTRTSLMVRIQAAVADADGGGHGHTKGKFITVVCEEVSDDPRMIYPVTAYGTPPQAGSQK